MPVTLQCEAQLQGAYITVTGAFAAADVRIIHRELYDASRLPHLRYALLDMRRCSALNLSPDELEEFTRADADAHLINSLFVVAIVISADLRPDLQHRYRIYQSFYANTVELFESVDQARAWIQAQLAAKKA